MGEKRMLWERKEAVAMEEARDREGHNSILFVFIKFLIYSASLTLP